MGKQIRNGFKSNPSNYYQGHIIREFSARSSTFHSSSRLTLSMPYYLIEKYYKGFTATEDKDNPLEEHVY